MLALGKISCAESCLTKIVVRLKVAVQRAKLQLVARRLRQTSNLTVVKSKKAKATDDRTRKSADEDKVANRTRCG
jgi:hypothetical protein